MCSGEQLLVACLSQVNRHGQSQLVGLASAGMESTRLDRVRGMRRNPDAQMVGNMVCLRRGLQAAEETGKPLLYGIRNPKEWSWDEQMKLLRPGDVMTYLFRPGDWSIVNEKGTVHAALIEARDRGVLFDVGHGMTSFDFSVAEAALADGFGPDTISTDQYLRHVGSTPQHDLPRTMSKLLAAGMNEADVFRAVTIRPAEILGLEDEIGSLNCGTCADLTVLRFNEDALPLQDVDGTARPGGCWEAVCTIRNGERVSR